MTQGDLSPDLVSDLTDASGNPIDLTTATAVEFWMDLENGENKIVGEAAIIVGDPTEGRVRYSWQTGDTDTVGTHRAQFRVTFPTAKPVSFPNDDYIYVPIIPAVGA